ncbi:MAG TPA: TolC family protein [Longimicrobiales bacterium]
MRTRAWVLAAALALAQLPGVAAAQQGKPGASAKAAPGATSRVGEQTRGGVTELTLSDALARALEQSPDVRTAEAQVQYAEAQSKAAWSNALPQFNTQLAYSRALRSVFQNVGFTLPDSMKFDPNSSLPLDQRVKYLEDKTGYAALGALGSLFSNMPFGRANTWIAGLTITQPIFTGGRIHSGISIAGSAADAARFGLDETRSEMALQVKVGYYDAQLADRSVAIMQQSVELAREHLRQVNLRYDAGRASELDTLKAAVDLANLEPQLLAVRNGRELAFLNLKRLLKLPADAQLALTTELKPRTRAGQPVVAVQLPSVADAQGELDGRGAMQAASRAVDIGHSQVSMARAAFLPTVAFSGNFNRQAYPSSISFPKGDEWRDDWSVALAVQFPLFQGLKRTADLDAAHAQLRQAQVQHDNLRDAVRIQYQQAWGEFERGKAQVDAAARTAAAAQKVYDLTELRYSEGLATQLDVSSARLALQQARINEAQAYHDAYAALARAERALGMPVERTTLP